MIGAADFSVFSVVSPVSKIRDCVAEVLRYDQKIAQFLDATLTLGTYGTDGRIYLTPTPVVTPDKPLPFVAVYSVREKRGKVLAGEVEITATIGISLFWDETREVLTTGSSRTCEDFFNRVHGALAADQMLELTPLGIAARGATGKGLADSMGESEVQDLMALASKDDGVTVEKALFVNYTTTASILTGIPQ